MHVLKNRSPITLLPYLHLFVPPQSLLPPLPREQQGTLLRGFGVVNSTEQMCQLNLMLATQRDLSSHPLAPTKGRGLDPRNRRFLTQCNLWCVLRTPCGDPEKERTWMGQGPLPQEAVPKPRPGAGRVGAGVGAGRLRRERFISHTK